MLTKNTAMNFYTSALILAMCAGVDATSIKMDFLPFGAIRTDPLLNPTCLSDHVHTMYGAKVSVRPELTYDDMRQAPENSGNTEENMVSLGKKDKNPLTTTLNSTNPPRLTRRTHTTELVLAPVCLHARQDEGDV